MTRTALAVMAHPDDAEIAVGGTLAALVDADWDVHVLVVSLPTAPDVRRKEAVAAAAVLGVTVHLLPGAEGGRVEDLQAWDLVGALDRHMAEISPERVFTHWVDDTHVDHALVARATLSACRYVDVDVYACEQANQFAPSVTPFPVDTYSDVSDTFTRKLDALSRHSSQMLRRDFAEHVEVRARYHGERSGVRLAEAFSCVRQRLTV